MDAKFFKANRQKIIHEMTDGSLLLLFSGEAVQQSADSYYPFFVNRNFYYMTGIPIAGAILMITKSTDHLQEALYIPNPESMPPGASDFPMTAENAAEISGVSTVFFRETFLAHLQNLITGTRRDGAAYTDISTIYADMERRTFDSVTGLGGKFIQKIREWYPYLHCADAYRMIANFRRIKSPGEVEEIRRAVAITKSGILAILRACRSAENECELEAAFRFEGYRTNEHLCAFPPIIACGKNAMAGHYSANCRPLADGKLIQLDVGWTSGLYCADVSRAIPASGTFTPEQAEIYQAILDGHRRNIALLHPGITRQEHVNQCRRIVEEELEKIGYNRCSCPGLWCFGGMDHYIGLDVHDTGYYDSPLQPGMVVTLDSAVRLPDKQFAFRLEDDLLITENGCENLSAGIPIEIAELERMMNMS